MLIPLQTIGAAPAPLQQSIGFPEIEAAQPVISAPGSESAADRITIASQEKFSSPSQSPLYVSGPIPVNSDQKSTFQNTPWNTGSFGVVHRYVAPAYARYNFYSSNLTIRPITAYNVIVDSNVLTPASYGPSAATIGAQFCNTSGSAMTDVRVYVGDFDSNNNGTLNEAGDSTPGVYPRRTSIIENPSLNGATSTDYGDASRTYSLKQESGSLNRTVDASRYLGTLAAGECKTQYWLISYPRIACFDANPCNTSNATKMDVTGGVQPNDDLWLPYFFWATSNTTGSTPSYYWNPITMRNEISAMANKIWPNGDNKVPPEYVAAIQQVLGWDTWTPNDPTGATAYPGETVTSQGIWYDLGNIGAGFDNNFDLVPDRNAWVQPIGDAGSYDPGCFNLVRTYGLIIVKLNDGTELLIPFVDQMYFENIPDNNTGAVGLVFYEYIALDGACTAGLTPYQEVASGYDNEKFNGDFGAGIPPLQSQQSNMTLDKTGPNTIGLTGTINYSLTFTLPDVDPTVGNNMTVTIGSPSVGMPLTYYDAVPIGLQYVANSASSSATMTNYTPGSVVLTRLFSIDGGSTWSTTDPGNYTSTTTGNQLHIQWQLASGITSPASGSAVTGQVGFSAVVPGGFTSTVITNTACMKIGSADGFVCDPHTTLVSGNSAITGTVWKDDGIAGGTAGNGAIDGTEAGIGDGADADATGVTVNLYWDNNGDGDFNDAGDFLYATTTTDSNGDYCFGGTLAARVCTASLTAGLPAADTAGAGNPRYIIAVDPVDGDIPTGYGPTTTISYTKVDLPAASVYGDVAAEPSDFGFAPALSVTKRLDTTSPVTEGNPVQFTLTVSNTLPGSGGSSASCSYYVWANTIYPTTWAGAPDGGGPTNAQFQSSALASGRPDERFSYSDLSDNTDYIGLSGFNLGNMGGDITRVEFVVDMHERLNFKSTDNIYVHTYYNDAVLNTGTFNGGTYFTGPTGTAYLLTADITAARTWVWSDFSGDLTEMQIEANKGGGAGSSGDIDLDGAAFKITTNGTCGGSNTILNPVPLIDEFDNTYLQFVSAVPPISGQSTSGATTTLSWANVGALYPGESKYITVNFIAKSVSTSTTTTNYDESTGAKFISGASANSDLKSETNNQAQVTITPRGSISGRIWNNPDDDGWVGTNGYETGEIGIGDVNVRLYACQVGGNNFTYPVANNDRGDPCSTVGGTWTLLETITTGASGDYLFDDLAAGFYYVDIEDGTLGDGTSVTSTLPTNAVSDAERDSSTGDQDAGSGQTCGTCNGTWGSPANNLTDASGALDLFNYLDGGEDITNVNFAYNGFTPALFGYIWQDYDGDGVRDSDDPALDNGVSGVTVTLVNCGADLDCSTAGDNSTFGTIDASTTGFYMFDNLTVGRRYQVTVNTATLPAGTWVNTDEDAPSGSSGVATQGTNGDSVLISAVLANGDLLGGFDFGYHQTGSYVIGDTLFYDWDGDGTQDAIDEGMKNVDVLLYSDLDNDGVIDLTDPLISTATTDVNGKYCFGGTISGGVCTAGASALIAGNYIVKVKTSDTDFPTNVIETKDPGEIGICVICDSLNKLTLSASNLDQDFGYKPAGSGTIGDTVFKDLNGNGIQSSTETGIAGVTAELQVDLNGDGTYVTIATDVTDSSGNYLFTGLPAGNYRVSLDLDNTPYANSTAIPNDSLGNDYKPSTGTTSGGAVYLDRTLATNTSNDLTADFGFAPPATIGDTVYQDINGNGTQDSNEPGISGVTVTLKTFTDANGDSRYNVGETIGSTVATTTTDSSGKYQFAGLAPGYYVVEVTPPAGSTLTGDPSTDGFSCLVLNTPADAGEPNLNVCDNRDGLRVYNGTNYTGADFGYQIPGSVGDTVWIDTDSDGMRDYADGNNNGVQDLNEAFTEGGIPNITVTLRNCGVDTVCGNGDDSTTTTSTNIDGGYSFSGLANGTYRIEVDTTDAQWPSGLPTTPVYDPDGTNNSQTLVVVSGGVVTSVGGCATTPNGCDPAGDGDALNLDADFGYKFSGSSSLSGTICLETSSSNGFCGVDNVDTSGIAVTGEVAYDVVTVYLYKWTDDGDGIVEAGETTQVATTTTNASGDYSFSSLPNGVYYIVAIGAPQTGLDLTSTTSTINEGIGDSNNGDTNNTTQLNETLAGDGSTLSVYQVVNLSADTAVVDRDFAFKLNGSYDFGDLPDTYSTTLAGTPDGPRHQIPSNPSLYFGTPYADGPTAVAALVDVDGVPTADASGDGSDENGVFLFTDATNGFENSDGWTDGVGVLQFDIVGSGWLIGWMDFDGDGSFSDANEMIIDRAVSSGQNQNFTFTTPTSTIPGAYVYARFRLFPSEPALSTLAYAGVASSGEVEDYRYPNGGGVVTPVTLSYFRAQRYGSAVNFEWSTATETANIGFNIYVQSKDGGLIQINHELIPSLVTDSLSRQDYSFRIDMDGKTFFIEDISVLGETQLYGPFQLGQKYGDRLKEEKINQSAIAIEHKQKSDKRQVELKKNMLLPAIALQSPVLTPATGSGVTNTQLTNTLNLKVRKTGIYRVSYEMLKTAGLDLKNVAASKLTLLNRGVIVPIFVAAATKKFGPGDYFEFYGEGLDSIYSDTNIYTVQVNRFAAEHIPSNRAAISKGIMPLSSYMETIVVSNQRAYANYAPGEDAWYDTSMVATTSKSWTFPFQINGMAPSSIPQSLELVVWGATDWPATAPDHHLQVSINGVAIADEKFDGLVEQTIRVNIPAGTLREGENTLQLTLPSDTGASFDVVNLDKFSVSYSRYFQAQNGQLTFTATGKSFSVANLPTKNVVVYRIDRKGIARLGDVTVKAAGSTFSVSFAGTNKPATYIITTVEALYTPTFEATRTSVNLNKPAQYLIIAHPDFIEGLQPLVQARTAQGLTVSIVDVNDVYMQYSYGIFDPQAIKKYIAFASQKLGTEYILMVGGDTYDYHNYLGKNNISFIPSLYATTGPTSRFVPVDPLYADVDGNNLPDLAIGRFPVRTRAELDLMINKTLMYAAKDYGRTAVFASDKFDGIESYKDISLTLAASLPADWTIQNINMDDMSVAAAQAQLIAAMNKGTALVTYTGHSAPTTWSFSRLFQAPNAQALTNAGRPFVAVQWGCFNTYYVDPVNNTLVQSFLFSGDRGAVALLGASTRTDSESEELLGLLLTPRLGVPGMTVGQAVLDAKRELALTHPELLDVLLGWSLMGDPALMIQP